MSEVQILSSPLFWYNLEMETKYQVSKNILYNFLGQLILLFLAFFTTPYIIFTLGKESFGILVLIISLVGYFSILDFGLSTAIVKYISEAVAKKDLVSLKKIVSTALSTFLLIGILGSLLIIFLTRIIISNYLHISPDLTYITEIAFYISALGFFISMITVVFISILSAFQRMDIINSRNIFLGVLNSLGTVILLMTGFGLLEVVLWNVIISAIATIVFLVVITKVLPGVSFNLSFDRKIFLKLFKFGRFKFVSNISGQITFQLDRFLIGVFQPISFLAYYIPPLSMVQKSFTSLLNITAATFPAVSQSHALGDIERIKELYFRMSRLIAFIMFPILAIFFIGAELLLNLWLGKEFAREGSSVLKIFAVSYFFIAASAAPVVFSEGMNRPKIPAIFGAFGALISLTAALILIPKFGINGAALALLINCVLQVPIFVWYVSRIIIKVSIFKLLKISYIKPVFSTFIASVISFYFFNSTTSLINLFLGLLTFGISYLVLNALFQTFDEKDKLAVKFFLAKLTRSR